MHEPDSADCVDSLFPEHKGEQRHSLRISIKLPQPPAPSLHMPVTRSSERHRTSSAGASGSEYHVSEKSMEMDAPEEDADPEPEPEPVVYAKSQRGRMIKKTVYIESSDNDGDFDEDVPPDQLFKTEHPAKRTSQRRQARPPMDDDDDEEEEEEGAGRRRLRNRKNPSIESFIEHDEDEKMHGNNHNPRYNTRNQSKKPPPKTNGSSSHSNNQQKKKKQQQSSQRAHRLSKRNATRTQEDDFYNPEQTSSGASADADGSIDDIPQSSDLDLELEPEPEPEPEEEDGIRYSLRPKPKLNYFIPPPLEDLPKPPPKPKFGGGRNGGRSGGHGRGKGRSLGWSASGAELGRWMGMPGDDSDSDHATRTPRKAFGGVAPFGAGAVAGGAGGGGGMIGDLAAGGTPSNLGKIGDSALADADPLGVNTNVTFDEVGGLDDHIHALKEMTLLPLLYPEVFQRFHVTPPRGVLFHGPPGTGKTLLARALAASCRSPSSGRPITFFMRKGADCLSKWVGEAERQLRLLFEEARASQPSIIFFDEIDGLAPVRSSKQDQIHASIVSTLLALMDGMDGRGQVVVIGATNRPDAVDPALRRPGRFDREFYFGLPGLEAREKILGIMTGKWEGVRGLAKLTKGYGGADLRALCTEAALNAIQRRYPQVYKTDERLLLKPETIGIGLRDFMISIKKLVPSSARSSSSAATPLPIQFVPLLSDTLEKVKETIQRVMPVEKKLSALEEAEFEDEGGEEGALEREMLSQAMQTLRVYRPRVVIHGVVGQGQGYIGAAALHHLEGYHVQSLELGSLMSDSTRTVEAAIVQLFIEAKRNQPSVIYIPSLLGWCAAVSETSRSTVRAMLDTLAPTDPILLLAVVDGPFASIPRDVKAWFGPTKHNRVELSSPTTPQREAFFEALLRDVERPPNGFADGMKRRKRVLEVLEVAPPLEPRKPTVAELKVQEESDERVITLLKWRLGPILTELKRKFKRFTKRATEEYNFDEHEGALNGLDTVTTTAIEVHQAPNGIIDITGDPSTHPAEFGGAQMNGILMEQQQMMQQRPPLYDMDLERMQNELWKGRYLTPQDFLDDVGKMVHNADVRQHEDLDRLYKAQAMFTATQVSIQEFDPQLRVDCERMAVRERQRRVERRRKEKEEEKEKDRAGDALVNGAPVGARRSGRNNGQQPELAITDPVKLERRLKRQRGEEGSVGDSNGSEGELNGVMGDGGRDAKRTRIIEDDERDPLDTIGLTPSSDVRSHHVVRFAPQAIVPMRSLIEEPEPVMASHNMTLPPIYYPDQMVVDGPQPQRQSGFDPTLLNPMQPAENPFQPSPFTSRPSSSQFNFPTMSMDPADPFMPKQESFLQMLNSTPTPPLPPAPSRLTPVPVPHIRKSKSKSRTPEPPRLPTPTPPAPAPEPEAMVVERTPSPPLPDFHVDKALVEELRQVLRDSTFALTVEQLEQLRATCLGNVWRHRADWDRDELVRELLGVVKDFVEEVTADWDSDV
ncbi:hypothetical protein B0H34DRAFT_779832 [Crassisporium funariophilum]|nr:hypothetical protein B0H34DRAFT_779832 [Crassisporium funariophilum]